jgi:hypothetical protein
MQQFELNLYKLWTNGCKWVQQAKIDVKTSTFMQLLLHLSMWCHFNGKLCLLNNMDIEIFEMNKTIFQY